MDKKLVPILLKLGGSVITMKDGLLTPDLSVLERLVDEIVRAKIESIIIVHGGGSFGHPIADQYQIVGGYVGSSQIIGFSKTRQAMVSLNKLVVDTLIHHDIPAVSIQPSACIITKKGRILQFGYDILQKLLKLNFVPVLYGDAVIDVELGFTVLSGDQLISNLATLFGATTIIMCVDVDGLYTTDPKEDPDAKLIEHINLKELRSFIGTVQKAQTTDVTGGMHGKIVELIPALEMGARVKIINARKIDRLYKALRDEDVEGTMLERW